MRITINKKIIGLFLALVVIFIMSAGSALLGIRSLRDDMREAITISRKVNLTGSLQLQANKLLIPVNQYLLTGDVRERDRFDGIVSGMSAIFSRLRAFNGDKRWQAVASKVEKDAIEFGEKAISVLYIENPVGNKDAYRLMNELNGLSDNLVREVDEFHKTTQDDVSRIDAEAAGRIRRSVAYSLSILAVMLSSVLMLYYYLKVFVTTPIRQLHEGASIIARGDLAHRLDVRTGDELEDLAGEFNKMARDIEVRTRELKRLSIAIERSINVIFITDVSGKIEYVNPMFEQTTGWPREEAIGQTPRLLASHQTPPALYEELWHTILAGRPFGCTFKNLKKNGQFFWANAQIVPIKDEAGKLTHFLAIEEDITDKKKAEEVAEYLGNYDELTGLVNRARFIQMMNDWITGDTEHNSTAVIFLLDIDGFKFINDTYGHLMGDNFLQQTAVFLKDAMAGLDAIYARNSIIARLGGDEFAVFLRGANRKDGEEAAEQLRNWFELLRSADGSIHSSVSIGIAAYPEHGRTTKELLRKVDVAMYRAEEAGRNRCHVYQPQDHDLEKIHSRLKEKDQIQTALTEDRFEPWFQPILDLKDNEVHHYEALARMRGTDGAIFLPGSFINTAETFGLVGAIDRMIIAKAIRLHADIHRRGHETSFSVNLSGKDLGDAQLLEFIKSTIQECKGDPDNLLFEITETAAIHDMSKALTFINGLKSIGCHFCLDDFGVGFTSFVYLKEMGVDYIKIDGSFIKKLDRDKHDQLFVKAIVGVAKGMGIKTIAEFVETPETMAILKELGVDYAQGYLVGKPAPWEDNAKAK